MMSLLLSAVFLRLIPWLLMLAIDGLKAGAATEYIARYALFMVLAAALGGLFLYAQRWLLISTSRRIEFDIRGDLFRHVQRLDLGFFGEKRTGDLMAHFTNDLNAIRDVAGPGLMYAVSMTIALVTSLTLMIIINPALTAVAFAPYPIIALVTFFFGRAMHKRSRRVQDLFAEMSSRIQEDLMGVRVIRAYVQEKNCTDNFSRLSLSYLEANMAVARLRGCFMSAMGALAGSGLAIALLVGGGKVINGTLSLGSLVAFSAYLAELTWPVIAVGFVIGLLQRGASAAGRLEHAFDASSTIISGPDQLRPQPAVLFDHVSFRYPGAIRNALDNISFKLSQGQTLGVVGRTGSGKSTILKLLLRFYDPTEGVIRVGGKVIRQFDLSLLRSIFGYAPQDGFLFSRSVAENISFGNPNSSRPSVELAATTVQLKDEVLRFDGGFDALVGERGVTMSGGQQQRVSLARALLLDPDLMLLDDTLSSVDAETETRILEKLKEFGRNRTSVIVSHRISAVQDADLILVLDGGRILEEGTHSFLIEQGGLYARLYERQRLSVEIEDLRANVAGIG